MEKIELKQMDFALISVGVFKQSGKYYTSGLLKLNKEEWNNLLTHYPSKANAEFLAKQIVTNVSGFYVVICVIRYPSDFDGCIDSLYNFGE
jgi:hypothetical protein